MNIPKCRAWDQTNHEWITYGFCLRFDADGNGEVLNAFAQPFKDHVVVPVFGTGRQDKHGHEIYAGDLVRTDNEQPTYDSPVAEHYHGTVYYDEERAMYRIKQPDSNYKPALTNNAIVSIEVVGNIWENSNLLLQEQ